MQSQLNAGFDTLLTRNAGERLRALRDVIQDEVMEAEREEIDGILRRFSSNYGVTFYMFRPPLKMVGGPTSPINESLEVWLTANMKEFPQRAPRGKGPKGRRPTNEEEQAIRDLERFLNEQFPEPSPPTQEPPSPAQERPNLRPTIIDEINYLKTSNPVRHWVSLPIQLPSPEPNLPSPLSLLVVESLTMGANGLLFDPKPWIHATIAVVAICVLFWLPLVLGITRYLRKMVAVTEGMADGHFDQKIDTRRGDELGRLGRAINRLNSRLGNYVHGQRRFLGDIAHELCSPIARIQMALGILEQKTERDEHGYVDGLTEDTRQLSELVNELLEFSKASIRPEDVLIEAVPVAEVLQDVVRREISGFPTVDLDLDIDDQEKLEVRANREMLSRSLANLVRNALRYAGDAGPIEVSVMQAAGEVSISVSDHGPGISEDAIDHVFDPFYRPDTARTRESGGVGLGLAIVKTCVEACRGRISCRNRDPHGLEVILYFPSALYFSPND